MDAAGRTVSSPLLPTGLAAVVLLLDMVMSLVPFRLLMGGLLDEPAHLCTAALVLLALAGPPRLLAQPTFALAAVVGSVLIDVDHVPLYLGVPHVADAGRPYSHCLVTVAVLLLASRVVPRWRAALAGLSVGVGLHFVRDVATGPGLQLWVPVDRATVLLPYRLYGVVLLGLAVVATARAVLSTGVTARGTGPRLDVHGRGGGPTL